MPMRPCVYGVVPALQLTLALVVMAAFALARRLAGCQSRRRVVLDNLALLWHYTVAQGLIGLLLIPVSRGSPDDPSAPLRGTAAGVVARGCGSPTSPSSTLPSADLPHAARAHLMIWTAPP